MVMPPRLAMPPAVVVPAAPAIMTHVPVITVAHMLIAHIAVAHVAHAGPAAIARRAVGLLLLHGRVGCVGHIAVLALAIGSRDCKWCSGQYGRQQQGLAYSHDEPPNMVARGPHRVDCAGATVIVPVGAARTPRGGHGC